MAADFSSLLRQFKNLSNSLPKKAVDTHRGEENISVADDFILPFELYRGKRDNITKIGDQINKAYKYGIYDGCTVLMRRLVEMLLILAYKSKGIENEIRNEKGDYRQLSDIIANAVQNPKFNFTRNGKEYLRLFKDRGDLSAHNPFHNAIKPDLDKLQLKFRDLIEILFYIAEIL